MNLSHNPNPAQTLAMTACMLAISNVDGVHPAETALIQSFYDGGRNGGPAFDEVQGMHTQAMALLQKLPSDDDFAEALVTMCLMVGYADGNLSDAERDTALGFARSIGYSVGQFEATLQHVRDALIGSLASLPDAASVAALAREL